MNRYLLEIGTEELPAGFLQSAPNELTEKTRQALEEAGLSASGIDCLCTPRRLALMIDGLPDIQPDKTEVVKGPPTKIAYDAKGELTPAAQGFLKKTGADPKALSKKVITGSDGKSEEYLVLEQHVKGKPTTQLLPELLPDLVLGLSGSHFMAWGNYEIKFSRPIRWLVSLWNDKHIPVSIGPVQSGKTSWGHRVLGEQRVEIPSVNDYQALLKQKGAVIVDQKERQQTIWEQLTATAKKLKGSVRENQDLLDTVTMLVEYPTVMVGEFNERFLSIPDEVTSTVMIAHQKYFPLYSENGDTLKPCFMTISNGRAEAEGSIKIGNEKVITARLEDARFFYEDDQSIKLADRVEQLKGVSFQKGLGSMYDKAKRLEQLADYIATQLNYSEQERSHSKRAALLAKADLVTGMVFEFTELQGVMGQKYAELNNEPPCVSTGIFEHYLPRFTGDQIAHSRTGIVVGLADKIDSMVAVFAQKDAKLPTGSKDPMGLRRMATGVIATVLENNLPLNLIDLLKQAYQNLGPIATAPEATMTQLLQEFMAQRLKVSLLEQGYRHDVLDAAFDISASQGNNSPLVHLPEAMAKLEHLKTLIQNEKTFNALYAPANRIAKMLGDKAISSVSIKDIQTERFQHDSEKLLWKAIGTGPKTLDDRSEAGLSDMASYLVPLEAPINAFFEGVLVNDKDDAVRQNRYNLLSLLHRYYSCLADFSKLVVS